MDEIRKIAAALQGGGIPEGYDAGRIRKWAGTFQRLKNPRVVKLYPVRDARYDDSLYRTFAFSLDGKDIGEKLLAEIKEAVSQAEINDIRYDSVQSHGADYYYLEEGTGKHITDGRYMNSMKDEDRSGIMNISDLFDGVVLYTGCAHFNRDVKKELDCSYAWIGKEKEPDEYKFVPMPNKFLGLPGTVGNIWEQASGEEEASHPAVKKYQSVMQIVTYILIAAIIWYFFRHIIN